MEKFNISAVSLGASIVISAFVIGMFLGKPRFSYTKCGVEEIVFDSKSGVVVSSGKDGMFCMDPRNGKVRIMRNSNEFIVNQEDFTKFVREALR